MMIDCTLCGYIRFFVIALIICITPVLNSVGSLMLILKFSFSNNICVISKFNSRAYPPFMNSLSTIDIITTVSSYSLIPSPSPYAGKRGTGDEATVSNYNYSYSIMQPKLYKECCKSCLYLGMESRGVSTCYTKSFFLRAL